jgi:hypothetical protein
MLKKLLAFTCLTLSISANAETLYYGSTANVGGRAVIHDPVTGQTTISTQAAGFGFASHFGLKVIDGIYYGVNGNSTGNKAVTFDPATGQSTQGQGALGFNAGLGFDVDGGLYYGSTGGATARIHDPVTGQNTTLFPMGQNAFGLNLGLGFDVIDGVYYGTNGSQAVMWDTNTGLFTRGQGTLGFIPGQGLDVIDGIYYGRNGNNQARIHDPATGITTTVSPTSNTYNLNLSLGFDVIDGIYYGFGGNKAIMFDLATGQSTLGAGNLGFNPFSGFAVVTTVPIPAAAWLFGSALLGLIGISRRKRA